MGSCVLAIAEPAGSAVLLLIFGLLCACSVLFSRAFERLGIPIVLLFLILGVLGGSEGLGRVWFDDYRFAARLGTMALVLILFDGGFNTSYAAMRQVLAPALTLATVGVVLTALLMAVGAHALGMDWHEAMLLGAIVSCTDAAAVFAVLRAGKVQLRQRLGRALEVESCTNDPMAVILTLVFTQAMASPAGIEWWKVALEVPLQLAIGTGVGAAVGWIARVLLVRLPVGTVGLLPVLTISLAFVAYGAATLAQGSGFMAVFIAALILGNGPMGYRAGLARVHDALAWLAQVAMFLMLGLLVMPSDLMAVAPVGLLLALFLAIVARPAAVVVSLLPFRFPVREVAYLAWVGLRGAVPIVLAIFPVLAGVPGGPRIFNIVFFIVVLSTLVPGATVRWVTRLLRLGEAIRPTPEAVLEINSPAPLDGMVESFPVTPTVAICGATLAEIPFPEGAAVVLLVRGRQVLPAKGNTTLAPGDHAYVFFRPEDRELVELLFGAPEGG
jgi:cell volume regulation protein A